MGKHAKPLHIAWVKAMNLSEFNSEWAADYEWLTGLVYSTSDSALEIGA